MDYAELHCLTNFSFLRGASHAQELVDTAIRRGYKALAITDECSLAGVVRAHTAVKEHDEGKKNKFRLIIGAEFRLDDGLRFVLLATNRQGYGNLSGLITRGRRNAPKGEYRLARGDLEAGIPHCLALWLPPAQPRVEDALWLAQRFPARCWIAIELLARGGDRERLAALQQLGRQTGLPCVAGGDVHMHARGRRALQDTLTAIRLGVPVARAGLALQASGERHLRPLARLGKIYPPELLDETVRIAALCDFSLDELKYEYPAEIVPDGMTPAQHLRALSEAGLRERYPGGTSPAVRKNIEEELALIAELRYEAFFLTVHDIVRHARAHGILCQGRGSAANSAVCYALGITEVNPEHTRLLFGRFLSKERNEPPDIDVDFEHGRREEVIQYIYRKYGRHRTALAATVISYRTRSAFRDVGKALGLDAVQLDRIASSFVWWDDPRERAKRLREAGFDPQAAVIRKLIVLTGELSGFPRHLSQHVGGFVISGGPLSQLVPTENAAMPGDPSRYTDEGVLPDSRGAARNTDPAGALRTNIQWDKDDLDALGLLKVDVLALGMLTAIRIALGLVNRRHGSNHSMASILAKEATQDGVPVYDMLCKGDSIGVFQVESRAQMSMLPRLKPRKYYDLVVEVAIVRPGPIQGGMVHPYLKNREKHPDEIKYPSQKLKEVLERTLGVPIFQEQVMEIAMVAAGFTAGEADQLRRAMAAWKRKGGLEPFKERLVGGMLEKGYPEKFALQIFEQIKGFGEYGFPESHSASFALLVYVSAWLKRYEPAAFTCALLNSQPMGFYAPAQLVQDAQRHGVDVRPVDVLTSGLDCSLEETRDAAPGGMPIFDHAEREAGGQPALRLGLRMIKGLSKEGALRLIEARRIEDAPLDVGTLALRANLSRKDMNALAAAGALESMAGHRRQAAWQVAGIDKPLPVLAGAPVVEAAVTLPAPTEAQDIVADYATTGLTLRRHPLALLRPRLEKSLFTTAAQLQAMQTGIAVHVVGLVTCRQHPGTAKGVIFVTLEDETGQINVVVWEKLSREQRRPLLNSRLLHVEGRLERSGEVIHVIAENLIDRSRMIGNLNVSSRDFH
ncbi:MAG TPA: error-prone DNA polymerase [Burkholderiales bacterium]|nr:error-prone DNA polymerase [Burkholderiales bacterium]